MNIRGTFSTNTVSLYRRKFKAKIHVQPSFEVTIETKRHRYCRSHQGGHIRTLRRGSYRRAVSGNIYGIQELFARIETVGIQPRDRHAGEMHRKVFINRHFVVASFVRTGLCLRNEHDYCVFEPIKQTSRHACARIERAVATSRGETRGNSSRNCDEKPFQDAATVVIIIQLDG